MRPGPEFSCKALQPPLSSKVMNKDNVLSKHMNTAAVIANIGLLVAIVAYLLTAKGGVEIDARELPLFGLMFAAPILSILALVKTRLAGAGDKPRRVVSELGKDEISGLPSRTSRSAQRASPGGVADPR